MKKELTLQGIAHIRQTYLWFTYPFLFFFAMLAVIACLPDIFNLLLHVMGISSPFRKSEGQETASWIVLGLLFLSVNAVLVILFEAKHAMHTRLRELLGGEVDGTSLEKELQAALLAGIDVFGLLKTTKYKNTQKALTILTCFLYDEYVIWLNARCFSRVPPYEDVAQQASAHRVFSIAYRKFGYPPKLR